MVKPTESSARGFSPSVENPLGPRLSSPLRGTVPASPAAASSSIGLIKSGMVKILKMLEFSRGELDQACLWLSLLAKTQPTHHHRLRTDKDCAQLTNIWGGASLKS